MRNRFPTGGANPAKSKENREKARQRMLGKNNPMYEKDFSEEHRKKLGDAIRGKRLGEKHPNWKGSDVTIGKLHAWIRRHKPKPNVCEECKSIPPYDVANISGEYLRDVNDYLWLCRSCHMKYDYQNGIRTFDEIHRNLPRDKNGYWTKYAIDLKYVVLRNPKDQNFQDR